MDEMVTVTENGVWRMDAAAFHPKPEGFLKIGEIEYPVFSFLDIPIDDSLRVVELGTREEGMAYDKVVDRGIEQIILLNRPGEPKLTRETLKALSPKQVILLGVMAASIAKVPLKAAGTETGNPNPSPSPSPESVVSMGGAETASSK